MKLKTLLFIYIATASIDATGQPLYLDRIFFMENEIWKKVIGYESDYEISNKGRLRSFKRRNPYIRKIGAHSNGYPFYKLCKDGIKTQFSIHRLVAIHFIPNPENKPQINHKNGIRSDFRIENLEWVTQNENMQHAHDTGLYPDYINKGEHNGQSKLTEDKVKRIIKLLPIKRNCELAFHFGVHPSTISGIRLNTIWTYLPRN